MSGRVERMDAATKKALRAEYKDRRSEMGVVSITCKESGETFLAAAKDIPAFFNRMTFQLSSGLCPNKRLQGLWNRWGEEAFELSVVQRLDDADQPRDDAEELETLLDLCLAENPEAQRWWGGAKRA